MEDLFVVILLASLAVLICIFILFFIQKKKKAPKTKAQKQEEIYQNYENMMKNELRNLSYKEYQNKKIKLLKSFSKELEFNIFFDKSEIYALLEKLNKKYIN